MTLVADLNEVFGEQQLRFDARTAQPFGCNSKVFLASPALTKSRPQPLTFGSGSQTGRGAGELFKERGKLAMTQVPYRGSPQALTDLMGDTSTPCSSTQ